MERAGTHPAWRGGHPRGSDAERAPNATAYAERFVRSIKEECLIGSSLSASGTSADVIAEFVEHYHRERNHEGIGNTLIEGAPAISIVGRIRRRLGGLLNYYERAA